MADPVLPGFARVLLVFQNANGLPEDRYITTWCFSTAGGFDEGDHDFYAARLNDFINLPIGAGSPVSLFLGSQVSRAVGAAKVITYDLGEGVPRTPHTTTFTVDPTATTGDFLKPLPAEVALCLSMKTATNGPRGMGRVYIGPFNAGALNASPESGESRPAVNLRDALTLGAGRLLDEVEASSRTWCVLSQTDGVARPITGGFVDNAFDTQRRRGLLASSRVIWPVT